MVQYAQKWTLTIRHLHFDTLSSTLSFCLHWQWHQLSQMNLAKNFEIKFQIPVLNTNFFTWNLFRAIWVHVKAKKKSKFKWNLKSKKLVEVEFIPSHPTRHRWDLNRGEKLQLLASKMNLHIPHNVRLFAMLFIARANTFYTQKKTTITSLQHN